MAESLIETLDNPFWHFSCTLYAEPAIQKACLRLQEQRGLNVNLLLYCFWLGFAVNPLSQEEFLQACEQVRQWQNEITNPLRALRKQVKMLNCDNNTIWLTDFYKQLLHQELCSEAVQQYQLYFQVKDRLRDKPQWDRVQINRYMDWLIIKTLSIRI